MAAGYSAGQLAGVCIALLVSLVAAIAVIRRHGVRRPAVFLGGWTRVLFGIALVASPCPGVLVILPGLALLATEFEWARKPLHALRARVARFRGGRTGPPLETSNDTRAGEASPDAPRNDGGGPLR